MNSGTTRNGEGAVEEPWDPSAATGEDAAVAAAAAAAAARRAQEAVRGVEEGKRKQVVSRSCFLSFVAFEGSVE